MFVQEDSCLAEKLGRYIALDAEERELLDHLEGEERSYGRGAVILEPGQENNEILVVRQGWLFTSTTLPDGRRQVLRLHFPGDVLGLPEMPLRRSPHELQAATDCRLCPLPKSDMGLIFRRSPRLAALFFNFALMDQLMLLDRIRALGRMSARERIAHFLLEIWSRLRLVERKMGSTFPLPLTQAQIADVLGLTNVYVSKSLTRLREEGLISMAEGSVTIEDETRMRDLCDFEDRYREIDTGWMPGPNS